jgi:DNA gyrase subunit A
LLEQIKSLLDILQTPDLLMDVIRNEIIEIRDNFGSSRMTEILESKIDLDPRRFNCSRR